MLILFILCVRIYGVVTDSIKEIPPDFHIPPGAENSTAKDHNKVIMCKVFLSARKLSGKGKYDFYETNGPFDGNLCTHLIISWFNINDAYEIIADGNYDQLNNTVSLKSKFPHLKIFLEVATTYLKTDSSLQIFSKRLTTSLKNNFKFIRNMKTLLKIYGYDGLHLGPQLYLYSTGNDFTSFAMNLRDEFHNVGLLLSTEIESSTEGTFQTEYKDIALISKILDLVVVRTYGFHNHKSGIASHQAPLYSNDENVYSILSYLFTEKKMEPRSTVLGIALYGNPHYIYDDDSTQLSFGLDSRASLVNIPAPVTKNVHWTYYEICSTVQEKPDWKMYWDNDAKVPFIKNDKKWISFENPQSVYEKIVLTAKIGVRGIMFRSSEMDDFLGLCGNVTNPVHKTANYASMTNEDGTTFCSLFTNKILGVKYKPSVSTDYYVKSVTLNSTAEIKCTAEGNPEPYISIIKYFQGNEVALKTDSEALNENRTCTFNRKKVLTLKWDAVDTEDLGKYSCSASNSFGTVKTSFFLTRHDKPFVVADDDIWVEETDADFIFATNLQNHTISKHSKVVICEMSKLNAKENVETFINSDGNLCTHLLYGNVFINDNYKIEGDTFVKLLSAKSESVSHSDVKILLRLSLDNPQDFKQLQEFRRKLSELGNSQKLIKDAKNELRRFGIHGLYFANTFGFHAEQIQFANALRKEFKNEEFLLATEITIDNLQGKMSTSDDIFAVSQTFDVVIVKGYNFPTTENIAAHNSPLNSRGNESINVDSILNLLLNEQKILAKKLVIALPTFGYHYLLTDSESFPFGLNGPTNEYQGHLQEKQKLSYKEICKILLTKNGNWKMYWDRRAKVPFAKYSNKFLTFDNPKSIYEKSSLALRKGLLGVMVSFIDFDDDLGTCDDIHYPLLKTVNFAFRDTQPIDVLLDKDDPAWSISWKWIVATISFCFAVIFISAVYARRKLKTEGLSEQDIKHFKQGASFRNSFENPENSPYNESFEIPKNSFSVDKTNILGMGEFGIIFKGTVNGLPVAVKSTKPGADKQYFISILSELKIHIYVGKHPHIVDIIGAHTTELNKGVLYIFVELCPLGNLQDYLRRSRDKFTSLIHNDAFHHLKTLNDDGTITTDNLLNWTYQIALALEYLSSKKIIHGDLAARNVLLFEQNLAKLTDFGLSRKLYQYSNYVKKTQEPLPWRWMAIESLRDLTFSIQSDIWSFAVTAWEIFSLAEVPYPGMSWSISFVEDLQNNLIRLPKAKFSTTSLYKFMLECWKVNPDDRPQPQFVSTYIHKLMQGSAFKDYYLEISRPNSTSEEKHEMETKL